MITVETQSGKLAGEEVKEPHSGRTVDRHLGIPFAAPPVGPLRLQPPAPPEKWEGTRPATAYGLAPPQTTTGPFSGIIPGQDVGPTSEDCLTLNVWAPAGAGPGDNLPVLFWLAGGAFVIGAASLDSYDGARLAATQNVIVVSANYRLGALGFLTLPGQPTNYGLRDQLAALAWVQENIAAFGGDPGSVTVFGLSAGAGSILHLLAAPSSAGLFRRAIMQSPGAQVVERAAAEALAAAFLRAAGIEGAPEKVGDLPVDIILAAQETAATEMASMGAMPWHPVVDGEFLPAAARTAIEQGASRDVGVIIGTTAEELRLFIDPSLAAMPFDDMVTVLQLLLTPQLGGDPGLDNIRNLLSAYRDAAPEGADIFTPVVTDASMRAPAVQLSDALSTRGDTFAYSFEWSAPKMGAFHGLDIPFTFGTLDRNGWDEFAGTADDPAGEQLSVNIMDAWGAFARTGDPSSAGVGHWPRYDATARMTMILGPVCNVVEHPVAKVLGPHKALRDAAAASA